MEETGAKGDDHGDPALRYFISAAEHLNFTKAARECYIVQGSMTQQIASLEEELGMKLFERRPRGLALTEAGAFFLPRARTLVQEAQKTETEINSFKSGYRAVLRVGYCGEIFKSDFIDIFRDYRRQAPQVKVLLYQMAESRLEECLQDGQLDVTFLVERRSLLGADWIELDPVIEIGPSLVVGPDHPLAGRRSVTMEEVARQTQIEIAEDVGNGGQAQRQEKIAPWDRVYGTVFDHTSAEILVSSGYGASMWAERVGARGAYPDLRFIPISDPPGRRWFYLAWRKGRLSREGELFRTLVHQKIKGDG